MKQIKQIKELHSSLPSSINTAFCVCDNDLLLRKHMASSAGGTDGVFCAFAPCRTFVWAPCVWCHMFSRAIHDTSARHGGTAEVDGGAWCDLNSPRALTDDVVTFHHCRLDLQLALPKKKGRTGRKKRRKLTSPNRIRTRLLLLPAFHWIPKARRKLR